MTKNKSTLRSFILACFIILFLIGVGFAWFYQQRESSLAQQNQIRISELEKIGISNIEKRRWPEATKVFNEIESLSPGSKIASNGRHQVEAALADEQKQFIGYWTGQAQAELEAGSLDEATTAIGKVLNQYPGDAESKVLLARIQVARISQAKAVAMSTARTQLDQKKFQDAILTANGILTNSPNDLDAMGIITDAKAGIKQVAIDQTRAKSLLEQATARDHGQFDQQALDWLREARSLAPENVEIAALLEKFSNYTRTLHVPGDFATPQEALDQAHARDHIILAAQTWEGPLTINAAVDLQSEDPTKTIVECTPQAGSAITIGPAAKGARITGITFRHKSLAFGTDRFSVGLIRGGTAYFTNCQFTDASGHGLAVIEQGHAVADHCRFTKNGWDGVAAIGTGATIEIKNSEASGNFQHGLESWNGASAIFLNNRCDGNSLNGIHVDNGLASAVITGNQLLNNRQFGMVIDSAATGSVSGNTAKANLMGGFVIRAIAGKLTFTGNNATQNTGPGLAIEKGLDANSYAGNTFAQNIEPQLLTNMDLSQQDPPSVTTETKNEVPPAAIIVDPKLAPLNQGKPKP